MMTFLHMGGLAWYVWPSYALTFVVAVLNIVWARRSFQSAKAEARRRLAMRLSAAAVQETAAPPHALAALHGSWTRL